MTARLRQAGFTLLEVLVALVVLGFILAALSQGTRFGLLALGSQSRTIAEGGDLDAVDRVLHRLIEAADPGSPRDPPPMIGTASLLRFAAILPDAVPGRRDQPARLALTVLDGSLVLRIAAQPPGLGAALPAATTQVLTQGVDRLALAYWIAGATPHWTDSWDARTLPALVRVRVVFAAGDRRHWPDIVVAPRRSFPAPTT